MEVNVPADRKNVQSKRSQQQSRRHKGTGHSTCQSSCHVRNSKDMQKGQSDTAGVWDPLLNTCHKHSCLMFDWAPHGWLGTLGTPCRRTEVSFHLHTCIHSHIPFFNRKKIICQKGKTLQSVRSSLARRKNKWPQSLSRTDTHRIYRESDRRAETDATSCSSIKNYIYKFLLWRICGLGIWSVLTAQPADTRLQSQWQLGCSSLTTWVPFRPLAGQIHCLHTRILSPPFVARWTLVKHSPCIKGIIGMDFKELLYFD